MFPRQLAKISGLPTVERWVRGKGPSIRENYLRYVLAFNLETGMDPEQFLSWAKNREQSADVGI